MTEQSNRYKLPYIMPAQAQKHVTHNEAIRLLDGLTNLNIKGVNMDTPPQAPLEGDAYLVGGAPTNQWQGYPGQIAVFTDGAWALSTPFQGLRAFDETISKMIVFDDGSWSALGAGNDQVEKFGINTQADNFNKLAVKSDAILFSTDDQSASPTGDLRLVLNKATSGDVNSVLFQTGYSGRVEMGCAGSDNFAIKVSADGNSFLSALEIDGANGNIGIGKLPTNCLDVERSADGQIIRSQIKNTVTSGGSGAALNVASGSHITQFLQYSVGAAYFLSSSSTFYLQTTGANPKIRLFAGSVNSANFGTENADFQVPLKLAAYTIATLPSASVSGAGSLVYVSDAAGGAVMAFSDGVNWRRNDDSQIVA